MKKTVKIILVVALVMVVVGGGLSATAWLVSGGNLGVVWNKDDGDGSSLTPAVSASNRRMRTASVEMDAFDRIEIDTDYGDVELIPSDSKGYRVEHATIESLAEPQIILEDGVLQIVNTPVGKKGDGLFTGLSESAKLFNRLGDEAYFRIYYPEDAVLTDVTLVSGLGEIEVKDTTISGTLDVTAHMGDIDLQGTKADRVTVESAMGEVDCEGMEANFLTVGSALGDVDVERATLGGLDANLDMGEGTFSGKLTGDLSIDASMGSVDVELVGVREDYVLDLDTDMGEIRVDGRKYSPESADTDAANRLTVSCNMGEINVEFTDRME